MATIYIGLGSNIDPEMNLPEAAALLRKNWPDIRFSSVFRSAPQEIPDQPDFLNAVAEIQSDDSPEEIIAALQKIERTLGKKPPFRYGPRTLDLDLLLYEDTVLTDPALTLPHPRMHRRRFVLEPLTELIDPDSFHPLLGQSWKELLEEVSFQPCEKDSLVL
jgi:2-amino-4-hydroxy-6-hydroxymethyldihydropteridine diphosphokinase